MTPGKNVAFACNGRPFEATQPRAGVFVYTLPADELKPGDLLFYSSGSNGRYLNIDHVAMYYGADYSGGYNHGMIVHARSGGVQAGSYDWYIPDCIVMICRPLK